MLTIDQQNILFSKNYGKYRRDHIVQYLRIYGKLAVNNKWQLQTNSDKDLRLLMKKGVIKFTREHGCFGYSSKFATKKSGKAQTYIQLV